MLCSLVVISEELRDGELKLHAERQNADVISWSLRGVTKFLVEKPSLQQSSRPEFPRIGDNLEKPRLHMKLCVLLQP